IFFFLFFFFFRFIIFIVFYFYFFFFFFNDTATTEIYTVGNTLCLHDALPIFVDRQVDRVDGACGPLAEAVLHGQLPELRSEEHTSELQSLPTISYPVFCL